mmetsp:Transcript_34413/g.88847  ORF Transcript_34413/g.88847 Transcript_34413/m.88847 type:complete len:344 (-) Transcript_34413:33-1064(-)
MCHNILEERTLLRLGTRPRIVLHCHREQRDPQSESIGREGVIPLAVVHLWCLVGALPNMSTARPQARGHREVDDLDTEPAVDLLQKQVLEAEVPVPDAQIVQPADRIDRLRNQRSDHGFTLAPDTGQAEGPGEEVAVRGQRRHYVHADGVLENTVEATHKRKPQVVQPLEHSDVDPRLLGSISVLLPKVLRPTADPIFWHFLHGDVLFSLLCTISTLNLPAHEVNLPEIPLCVLQLLHEGETTGLPRLHLRHDLLHGLRKGARRELGLRLVEARLEGEPGPADCARGLAGGLRGRSRLLGAPEEEITQGGQLQAAACSAALRMCGDHSSHGDLPPVRATPTQN